MQIFERIAYRDLNARQKENYNFQRVSSVLADYGFSTQRLSDDWNGADFIAIHIDGRTVLRIQLKGRLSFDKKYMAKDLWIAFRFHDRVYVYDHDAMLDKAFALTSLGSTTAWKRSGVYTYHQPPQALLEPLMAYRLGGDIESSSETASQ